VLIVIIALLAAANGANDTIKGAATLVGSGVIGYRGAIVLATLATATGGLASIHLANGLLEAFSGKGIVPAQVVADHAFLLAVAAGAALTVWLATWRGLPISTTHALLGGLLGAGFAFTPEQVDTRVAIASMLLPLLLSPLLAMLLAFVLIPFLRRSTAADATGGAPCLCVEEAVANSVGDALAARSRVIVAGSRDAACQPVAGRRVVVLSPRRWLDPFHLFSAATVSFARGLNDTPKIAALVVAGGSLEAGSASVLVVLAMGIGGMLAARRVAETLAFKVTRMDAGEGLGANMVTAALVIGASRLGMPVSTTHVSTGALFGIAAGNGTGQFSVIRHILLAWLLTLPLAGLFAYLLAIVLH
jgi:PiT family inorganic phosphate transporter